VEGEEVFFAHCPVVASGEGDKEAREDDISQPQHSEARGVIINTWQDEEHRKGVADVTVLILGVFLAVGLVGLRGTAGGHLKKREGGREGRREGGVSGVFDLAEIVASKKPLQRNRVADQTQLFPFSPTSLPPSLGLP